MAVCVEAGSPTNNNKATYFLYVGTYTEEASTSKGIYAYRFDSSMHS